MKCPCVGSFGARANDNLDLPQFLLAIKCQTANQSPKAGHGALRGERPDSTFRVPTHHLALRPVRMSREGWERTSAALSWNVRSGPKAVMR